MAINRDISGALRVTNPPGAQRDMWGRVIVVCYSTKHRK